MKLTQFFFKKEPEACETCRVGVQMFMDALNTPESLTKQEQLLIDEGCPNLEDPAGCTVGVLTWWRAMAGVIYSGSGAYVCQALEPACNVPDAKVWDCETCKADVQAMCKVFQSEGAAEGITMGLSGPLFCESPDYDLNEEQLQVCKDFVAAAAAPAFGLVFKTLEGIPTEVCDNVYGQCMARKLF